LELLDPQGRAGRPDAGALQLDGDPNFDQPHTRRLIEGSRVDTQLNFLNDRVRVTLKREHDDRVNRRLAHVDDVRIEPGVDHLLQYGHQSPMRGRDENSRARGVEVAKVRHLVEYEGRAEQSARDAGVHRPPLAHGPYLRVAS